MKEEIIVRNPKIQFGAATIKGTRLTVDRIKGLFEAGHSNLFISQLYGITIEEVMAAIRYKGEAGTNMPEAIKPKTVREQILIVNSEVRALNNQMLKLDSRKSELDNQKESLAHRVSKKNFYLKQLYADLANGITELGKKP